MPRLPKLPKNIAPPEPEAGPAVAVISPDGQPGFVPQAEISRALETGFQLDTPAAREEIAKQKQFGEGIGNEIAAAGFGAARTLTFGLSDLALAKTGIPEFSPEVLREIKERNPVASTVGEIGAFAIPLAGQALGAASTAGKVLQTAGGAVSGVGKLGQALGGAVSKATGSKLVGGAAQVAAESLAFNLAKNVSENVLGERELTAERILANSGQALALGAGLGFGAPLAVKGLTAIAAKAKEAIAALGTSLRERVFPAAAQAAADGYVGAFGAVTGNKAVAAEVKGMLAGAGTVEGKAMRDQVVKAISPEADDELYRAFTTQLDDVHRTTEKVLRSSGANIRPQEVATLLRDVDVRPGAEHLQQLIGKVRSTAASMADDPLFYDQAYRRGLENVATELEGKLMNGGVASAEELYTLVDKTKSVALRDLAEYGGQPIGNMGRAQQNAVKKVRDIYKDFAQHLEAPELYGDAAARQAGYNEAMSTYKRAFDKNKNNFRKFFLTNGEVDATKVKGFLRKVGSGRDVDAAEALQEFQAAAQGMIEQVELSAKTIGVGGEFHGVGHVGAGIDRAGFESLVKKMVDTQSKAAIELAETNKIRSHDMFGTAFMRFQETIGQVLATKGVLGATMNLAQKAASPFGVVKALSAAEGLALNTSKRVGDVVGRMVSRMGGAATKAGTAVRPFAEPASIEIMLDNMFGDDDAEKPSDRRDGFAKNRARLAELNLDPVGTAAKLSESVQHLQGAAPELARTLVDTQLRAIAFLDEKAPRDPMAGMSFNPLVQEWEPSDMEQAKFERYAAAVADPLGALDELESGSMSPEAVEAVRAVYPSLYEDVRMQLATEVAQIQTTVPYSDRVQLSLLFGVDLDPSLSSAFVNAVQNGYTQPVQAPRQTAYRPSSASAKIGTLEETQAQRISRR